MADKWQGMLLRECEVNPSYDTGERHQRRSKKGILYMRYGSTWVKELGPKDLNSKMCSNT